MSASRREFLKRMSALAATGAAAPLALNLSAMSAAAAQTASDYKAVVCLFMYGGNDHYNTVVTYDEASHAEYLRVRETLAFDRMALYPNVLQPAEPLPDGRQYALAPALAPLLPYFNQGQLGVLLNIGPLVQPTTLAQFRARSVPLPPKLFSHNDQQSVWQSLMPEGATSGWGGRMADFLQDGNGASLFTSLNMAGNAVMMSGKQVNQMQVSPSERLGYDALQAPLLGSEACSTLLRSWLTTPGTHLLERELTRVTQRALDAEVDLRAAFAQASVSTPFPEGNPLAAQLRTVARLISARRALGVKRQVFFVGMGNFDTHNDFNGAQVRLLGKVGQALAAFQSAIEWLGVAEQVTTFTASDFGRTLTQSQGGTDHGWGSMHLVLGGAVNGGRFFGQAPLMALGNDETDVGQGRLLPTLSVDSLAAALGKWMGLSDGQLVDVLPSLPNFSGEPELPLFRTA